MRFTLSALLAGCLVICGCGGGAKPGGANSATLAPALPGTFVAESFPQFSIYLPGTWQIVPGKAPLQVAAVSGSATIAVFRYPRPEKLPVTAAQLTRALHTLVKTIRRRNTGFVLAHARTATVAGKGAVELVGTETIGGEIRSFRSTHVFAGGAELVIDAYCDPSVFPSTDHLAFLPVVYRLSLR